jgi:CRP/FNR family transcriptional regulator
MPAPVAALGRGPEPGDLFRMIAAVIPSARSDTQRSLAEAARIRSLPPKDVVFRQGEPILLTLMLDGHASFRRTTADGRQLVLGVATGGDLFGFASISARRASVDVVTLTEARVAVWPGKLLRGLATDDLGLATDAIDGMARFIVDITERIDGFIHQNSRQRVIRVLARYSDLFFGHPAVLSRSHLPSLVGTSREMTSRVIRQLELEGMVARVGRNGLQLLAPARLHEAATSLVEEAS